MSSMVFSRVLFVACRVLACASIATPLVAQQPRWRGIPDFSLRNSADFVFDRARRVGILFGGAIQGGGPVRDPFIQLFGETWQYDGRRWLLLRPRHTPSPRRGHAMAFDPVTNRILLFGGSDKSRIYGDTWAWDGADWTQLKPASAPAARHFMTMATDWARKRIVLFGGALGWLDGNVRSQSDTWEWDGRTWIQRFPKTVPQRRLQHVMGWDAVSREMIMRAGRVAYIQVPLNYTWGWNGTDWKRYPIPTSPEIGDNTPLVTEPTTGHVVAFGRALRPRVRKGWRWNAGKWTEFPPQSPDGMLNPLYASDPFRRRIIRTSGGGGDSQNDCELRTWEWDGKRWWLTHAWGRPATQTLCFFHDRRRDRFVAFAWGLCNQTGLFMWELVGDELRRIAHDSRVPTRAFPIIVWVDHLGKLLMYGGQAQAAQPRFDTWLWDGRSWSEWKGNAPPDNLGAAVYDPDRRKVVFVGRSGTTWEWDERSGWIDRKLKTLPPRPVRAFHRTALAYDPVRRRVVLHGATTPAKSWTWEFDGQKWQDRHPRTIPTWRVSSWLQYVPALRGTLLFGGHPADAQTLPPSDTWIWDGTDWRRLSTTPYDPFAYGFYSTAYDVGRQRLLAAGFNRWGQVPVHYRWEFFLESLRFDDLNPVAGRTWHADVELRAQAGLPFLLAFALSDRPGIPLRKDELGVELLPLAPDPLFWLSLEAGLVGLLDGAGRARFPLRLPADPVLRGLRLHFAGCAFGRGGGVAAITNGVPVDIR